jgi:signal transduction histidine kinase
MYPLCRDIYNEAQRLISLVGDIIELSQRDEGSHDLEKES